jgi:tripartite-type tricarboxylate transporter receptor subunit TctC
MRRFLITGAAAVAAAVLTASGFAQDYPNKALRMIVPFPPGGGYDTLARPLSDKLSGILKQPVVVENRPGAGGNLGAEAAARAPADGYTLLFAGDLLVTNPPLYKSTAYDPVRDFAPISMVATTGQVIAVHPSIEAKNMTELIALTKSKPLNYGTPGIGSSPHLFGELLGLTTGIKISHVPYKGNGAALTDLITGRLDIAIANATAAAPFLRAGKIRAISLAGNKRYAFLPDVPTLSESGVSGFAYDTWYAVVASSRVPEPVLKRIRAATLEALAQPDLVDRLTKAGFDVTPSTPEAVTALIKAELAIWSDVVAKAKIQVE